MVSVALYIAIGQQRCLFYHCIIQCTTQKHKGSWVLFLNVRGVHINEELQPSSLFRPMPSLEGIQWLYLEQRIPESGPYIPQGCFCRACQSAPLWCLLDTLSSIWTAGLGKVEKNLGQTLNCVQLSNKALLSLKEKRIKNSCHNYSGKEKRYSQITGSPSSLIELYGYNSLLI